MPTLMRLLLVGYRSSLWFYPAELRRSYGADMTEAFAEILAEESAARGTWGVASASCRALREIFTIAVPGHIESEWMMTTLLLFGMNLGGLLLECLFFVRRTL